MKKILILGGTSMLGYGVTKAFREDESDTKNYDVSVTINATDKVAMQQNTEHFEKVKTISFNVLDKDITKLCNLGGVVNPDYIINCIDITSDNLSAHYPKEYIDNNEFIFTYANAAFPHLLSWWCKRCEVKLIHTTSSLVFDGQRAGGKYTEEDIHNATDSYGKSKSVGEPTDAMVLRTRTIGHEIRNKTGFLSWAIAQRGEENTKGYKNHFDNCMTTKHYGRVCKQIIDKDLYRVAKHHIFSPATLPEIAMLQIISKKYSLNLKLTPTSGNQTINRSLRSTSGFCKSLNIPDLHSQLMEPLDG